MSGFNGRVDASAGYDDNYGSDDSTNARYQATGLIKIPLGHDFGAAVDGMIGEFADKTTGGGGLHFFTRDPSLYLLGIQGQYMAVGSNDIWRVGPEAELYLDQFSIEAFIGYEDSDQFGEEFFAMGSAGFYPIENLRLTAGYKHYLDLDVGFAGVEWMIGDDIPLSIFANGEVGSDGYDSAFAGVRFYFNDSNHKSLRRRHREDDVYWNSTLALPRYERDDRNCVPYPSEDDDGQTYPYFTALDDSEDGRYPMRRPNYCSVPERDSVDPD